MGGLCSISRDPALLFCRVYVECVAWCEDAKECYVAAVALRNAWAVQDFDEAATTVGVVVGAAGG